MVTIFFVSDRGSILQSKGTLPDGISRYAEYEDLTHVQKIVDTRKQKQIFKKQGSEFLIGTNTFKFILA